MKFVLWIFLCVVVLVIVLILSMRFSDSKETTIISPIVETIKELEPFTGPSLQSVVTNELSGTQGNYGVFIKDLATGKTFSHKENVVFDSASLYKLWIMAETFRQIEAGKLDKETELSEKRSVLYKKHRMATDSADFVDEDLTMTVGQALEEMITISDNDAALLLSAKVRLANVAQLLKTEGFTNSSIGVSPTTTAKDIALFYEKLYNGELVSKEASEEMLAILSRQRLNDRIPKYLPNNLRVAHKTGELDEYKHDAGIVYTQEEDYIIVVLSKTNNPVEAAKRTANISKAVYDYFNN